MKSNTFPRQSILFHQGAPRPSTLVFCLFFLFSLSVCSALTISLDPPTPPDKTVLTTDSLIVAVSTSGTLECSSFIDFDRSLACWCRFNDAGDFSDRSSYAHATAPTGTEFSLGGKRGGARVFDGVGDYISIPNSDNLNITKNMTIAAWIKVKDVNTGQSIISKLSSDNFKQYALGISGGALTFAYEVDGNNYSIKGGVVSPDTWHHVAVTIDKALKITLYLDGSAVKSETAPAETAKSVDPVVIGRFSGSTYVYNSQYFNGIMDEIMIFKACLGESEIQALHSVSGNSGNQLTATYDHLAQGIEHTIKAISYDSGGAVVETEQRSVFLSIGDPVINLTRPQNNSVHFSPEIRIDYATSGDLYRIHHIYFQLDGGPVQEDPDRDGTYFLSNVPDGGHQLRVFMADSSDQAIGNEVAVPFLVNTARPDPDQLFCGDGLLHLGDKGYATLPNDQTNDLDYSKDFSAEGIIKIEPHTKGSGEDSIVQKGSPWTLQAPNASGFALGGKRWLI